MHAHACHPRRAPCSWTSSSHVLRVGGKGGMHARVNDAVLYLLCACLTGLHELVYLKPGIKEGTFWEHMYSTCSK